MANSKSQQIEVVKNSELCLNKYNADIVSYGNGFNKKNSPLLGGAITNVFNRSFSDRNSYYSDGNHEAWLGSGNTLYIDGKNTGISKTSRKFVVEDVKIDGETIGSNYVDCFEFYDITKRRINEFYYIKDNGSNFTIEKYDGTNISLLNTLPKHNNAIIKFIYTDYTIEYPMEPMGEIGFYYFYINGTKAYLEIYIYDTDEEKFILQNDNNKEIWDDPDNERVALGLLNINICTRIFEYTYIDPITSIRSSKMAKFILVNALNDKNEVEYGTGKYETHNFSTGKGSVPINGCYSCLYAYNYPNVLKTINGQRIPAIETSWIKILLYTNKTGLDSNSNRTMYEMKQYVYYPLFVNLENIRTIKVYGYRFVQRYENTDLNYSESYLDYKDYSNLGNFGFPEVEYYEEDEHTSSSGTIYKREGYTFDFDFTHSEDKVFDTISQTADVNNKNVFFLKSSMYKNAEERQGLRILAHTNNTNPTALNTLHFNIRDTDIGDYVLLNNSALAFGEMLGNTLEYSTDFEIPKPIVPDRLAKDRNYDATKNIFTLLDEYSNIQSFSYVRNEDYIGTLLVPFNTVSSEKPYHITPYDSTSSAVTYFDFYDNKWKIVHQETGLDLTIVGDFVLFNTTDQINAVNVNTLTDAIWANDWNNRFAQKIQKNIAVSIKLTFSYNEFYNANNIIGIIATNYNYTDYENIPSSLIFTANISIYAIGTTSINKLAFVVPSGSYSDLYTIDEFLDGKYLLSYNNGTRFIKNSMYNILSPNTNIEYTPAITMKFKESYSNKDYVTFGNIIYTLTVLSDIRQERILYDPDTQYTNIEDFFVIQGQSYFIQNNNIYKYTLDDNDKIAYVNFIINKSGLKYVASNSRMAYFWSFIDSAIYMFSADNTLSKLTTATDITDIYSSVYYPSLDMIVMATNIGLLCYNNDTGIFNIDSTDYYEIQSQLDVPLKSSNAKLFLQKDGYITYFVPGEVSDYLLFITFVRTEEFIPSWIRLSTKYYGAGSNIISINDCWYLRLYADKSEWSNNREGSIILSVNALTDQGFVTEKEKRIEIKESDWDDLTDTLYIRYQPKLQRSVGISLNVDSRFPIAYIGVGTTQETTQMSRPSMQV